jgi:hypothetical protein
VSFEQDVELSQMNEYEILQILMGDCRERLAAYPNSYEEDLKLLQGERGQALTPNERTAAKLRMGEMKVPNTFNTCACSPFLHTQQNHTHPPTHIPPFPLLPPTHIHTYSPLPAASTYTLPPHTLPLLFSPPNKLNEIKIKNK